MVTNLNVHPQDQPVSDLQSSSQSKTEQIIIIINDLRRVSNVDTGDDDV